MKDKRNVNREKEERNTEEGGLKEEHGEGEAQTKGEIEKEGKEEQEGKNGCGDRGRERSRLSEGA